MNGRRRQLIRTIALGLSLGAPALAWAQRSRILREDPPAPDPVVGDRIDGDLRRALEALRIGQTASHGALTVVWLHGGQAPPLAIATLDEARAAGEILITERESATVPSVLVDNRGKRHVLLLAGEILVGGKQDRVLQVDVLLPPRSGARDVGVYCVEQGRWSGRSAAFDSTGVLAAPKLRSHVIGDADQQRVWAEVNRYAREQNAPAASSFQGIAQAPAVKRRAEDLQRRVDLRAAPDACGAAVFLGAQLVGLDVFADPGLFARLWPKLLRALALESAHVGSHAGMKPEALRSQTADLLARAATAPGRSRPTAGVGVVFQFQVDAASRGAALIAGGHVVHVAVV